MPFIPVKRGLIQPVVMFMHLITYIEYNAKFIRIFRLQWIAYVFKSEQFYGISTKQSLFKV